MTWDWGWEAGPKGGALTALDPYVRSARLVSEGIGGKRGTNITIPYRDGARAVPLKFAAEKLVPLELAYRFTDGSGLVTHTDGQAGHVMENKGTVEGILGGGDQLVTLQRTTPHWGDLQIDVELIAPAQESQDRFTFLYLLTAPVPFWREATESNGSASPLTVGGNAPVDDAIVEFTGGTGFFQHTATGARIEVSGAAGAIRVDVGAGTCTLIADGSDQREFLTVNRPYWLRLNPGSNAFTSSNLSQVRWRGRVR